MSNTAFVLGNGESRRGIKIADLKQHGTVWACNGVYRTENPDFLVAVDPKMILEIAESDYIKHCAWLLQTLSDYVNMQQALCMSENEWCGVHGLCAGSARGV